MSTTQHGLGTEHWTALSTGPVLIEAPQMTHVGIHFGPSAPAATSEDYHTLTGPTKLIYKGEETCFAKALYTPHPAIATPFILTPIYGPTTPQVTRVTFSAADLGDGIGTQDDATHRGYFLYFNEATDRFAAGLSGNAKNFIAVYYDTAQAKWYYDTNGSYRSFTPQNGDRLVAEVDFQADTVTHLKGISTTTYGIATGYVDGDLVITPNQWQGSYNSGEFGVAVSYLEFEAAP